MNAIEDDLRAYRAIWLGIIAGGLWQPNWPRSVGFMTLLCGVAYDPITRSKG